MKKIPFLFTLFITLFLNCAYAYDNPLSKAPLTQPTLPKYTALVPVADETIKERDKAFPEALKQVLIRISNRPKIVNYPAITKPLADAVTIVKSYSYVKNLGDNQQSTLFLQVNFDPDSVDQILDLAPPQQQKVEQPNVNSDENVNNDTKNIEQTDSSIDQNTVITSPVTLKISGINQLGQQLELIKYLRSFNIISDVKLQNVSGDTVLLNMQVSGGQNALINILKMQHQLMSIDSGLAVEGVGTTLNYRWTN